MGIRDQPGDTREGFEELHHRRSIELVEQLPGAWTHAVLGRALQLDLCLFDAAVPPVVAGTRELVEHGIEHIGRQEVVYDDVWIGERLLVLVRPPSAEPRQLIGVEEERFQVGVHDQPVIHGAQGVS